MQKLSSKNTEPGGNPYQGLGPANFSFAAFTNNKKTFYYRYGKRILDILLSLIGIGLTLPIIVAAIIAIRLESPGPAFYIQNRVGCRGCEC